MPRVVPSVRAATLALILASCSEEPPVPMCSDVSPHVAAATAPDRKLLGVASPYPADAMLSARTDELETSQRARRAAAWDAIARVLAPVDLGQPTSVVGATVPRFRTWYDGEDFNRIFGHAYEALGPTGRAARAPIPDALLDDAFAWDPHALDGMPAWTDAEWTAYVARIHDGLDVADVGGLNRIAMSPDAARHVAASYPQILRCLHDGAPPAFVDGPAETTQRLARDPIVLDRCSLQIVGPFYVASGGTVTARLSGTGASLATLRLHAGTTLATSDLRCSAAADTGCTTAGPGPFLVELVAGGLAVNAMLEVDFNAADVPVAGCLDGVFPLASATVAQEWRRVELGPLPTYDTSAATLRARFAEGNGATWGAGEGTADPGPDEIYTLRVPSGGTFRLAGMHIRTRELDHWLNITMWWSPTPDETFGADRSDSVRALGGPWSHYAMCVSIDDVERDPDPTGGFGSDAPTLAAALAASHDGVASWCSNPYIDAAPGLVRTNCVGCHQHAFSGVAPGEVVMDGVRFPANGRLFVRNNFPADQFWGLDAGNDLASTIANTVSYWDTAAP